MNVVAGTAIIEENGLNRARLAGWFRHAPSGRAVALTVAHLLSSLPAPPTDGVVRDLRAHPRRLCTLDGAEPFALAVACGWSDWTRQVSSLDAAIAEPFVEFDAPCVACSRVRDGAGVLVGGRAGRVISSAWRSDHFGARADLLVEPVDNQPLTHRGDSGLLVEDEDGAVVGMVVGEVLDLTLAGRYHPWLVCAHPIMELARAFSLDVRGG